MASIQGCYPLDIYGCHDLTSLFFHFTNKTKQIFCLHKQQRITTVITFSLISHLQHLHLHSSTCEREQEQFYVHSMQIAGGETWLLPEINERVVHERSSLDYHAQCVLSNQRGGNYFCFINICTRVTLAHIVHIVTNTERKCKKATPSCVTFAVSYMNSALWPSGLT